MKEINIFDGFLLLPNSFHYQFLTSAFPSGNINWDLEVPSAPGQNWVLHDSYPPCYLRVTTPLPSLCPCRELRRKESTKTWRKSPHRLIFDSSVLSKFNSSRSTSRVDSRSVAMAEEQDANDPGRRQTTRADYSSSESPFATSTTVTSRQQQQTREDQTKYHEQPPTPTLPPPPRVDDDDDDGLTTDTDSDAEDYTRIRSNISNAAPNPVPSKPKKPGKLAAIVAKLGLDMPTVLMMFKYVALGVTAISGRRATDNRQHTEAPFPLQSASPCASQNPSPSTSEPLAT